MSKRRILIIDDDQDINNLFNLLLEHDGYKVNAYTDPLDAHCMHLEKILLI